MPNYRNQFLFSEAYLAEIIQIEEDSASKASMISMSEFLMYADLDSLGKWNKSFVHECLQSLGFRIEKSSENLALLKQHGDDESSIGICFSILPSEDLGNTSMGSNYAYEIITALKNNGLNWGILTNGHEWRIYHTDESTPYENYLGINLKQILESKDLPSYQLLFFFLKAENFVMIDGQCKFDIFKTESLDKIAYIEDELKKSLKPKDEGGEGVLSDICYGYIEYMRSKGISDFSDEKVRETIYGGALFYMFRLLFVFYAQARELLHELEQTELDFILSKINQYRNNNLARNDSFELWHSLNRISSEINEVYNGGLFNPSENNFTKFIDNNRIADSYLSDALFNLLNFTDKNKVVKPISYRDMNVRNLGTLYEGLLEHKLFVAEEDTEVRIVKKIIEFIPQSQGGKILKGKYIPAGQVYFGNDKGTRKASGSYYTPEYIVEYIVSNTVDEKLNELEARFEEGIINYKKDLKLALNESEAQGIGLLIKQKLLTFIEKEVLNLSVLDPAMGSGHFLVNATNHISNFITRFMNGYNIKASDTNTSTNHWRRRVVENCIYGVDLSVLATELAKLSLWILAMAKDKPLSFLNHNLKIGNSLIGASLVELGKYPFSDKETGQEKLFDTNEDFRATIAEVISEYELIRGIGSNQKSNIQEKQKHVKAIDELLNPYKRLCDFQISLYFGNSISESDYEEILLSRIVLNHIKTSPLFHWELEFPQHLIKGSGFSCIIGNPPWGAEFDKVSKDYFKLKFADVHKRTIDSFNFFLYKGVSLLSHEGSISIIIPNTFFFQNDFDVSRKYYLNNHNIIQIINLGDNIFKDVNQPCGIIILEKAHTSDNLLGAIDLRNSKEGLNNLKFENILQAALITVKSGVFIFNNEVLIKNSKLPENTLDEMVTLVNSGVTTGCKDAFTFSRDEDIIQKYLLETEIIKPIASGRNFDRYKYFDSNLDFLIYVQRETKIDEYPNIKNYLSQFNQELDDRSEVRQGILDKYALSRSRSIDMFEKEKIVLRETGDQIRAIFDDKNVYVLNSIIVLQLKNEFNPYYVLSLLNSRFVNELYQDMAQEKGRVFAKIRPNVLRKLPVPKIVKSAISGNVISFESEINDELNQYILSQIIRKKVEEPNLSIKQIHDYLSVLGKFMQKIVTEKREDTLIEVVDNSIERLITILYLEFTSNYVDET